MKNIWRAFAVFFISLAMSGNIIGGTVFSWELPFLPIKVNVSRANGIWLSLAGHVQTPIGVFGMEYTHDIERARTDLRPVYVGGVNVLKQDLLVVIRDRNKKYKQDEVYHIKNGYFLNINSEGKTNIQIREGMVIIDITNVDNFYVELSPHRTQGTNEIAYRLSKYYKNIALNRHDEVGKMYAAYVDRYYNLRGITRQDVVEQIKNYDNIFNVYSKSFDIQWGSLDVIETIDKYIVSYIINYTIDRRDKNLPTYFEIKMFVKMNKKYEIIDIYEKILKRE